MAIAFQIQFPVTTTATKSNPITLRREPPRVSHLFFKTRFKQQPPLISTSQTQFRIPKAIEEEKFGTTAADAETQSPEEENPTRTESTRTESEASELLGAERKERGGDSLWSGVAEEVREIEWPAFGKVLGITGVVLGVIAGSSVVLLTVNFVLAELSDKVFAGRGVQDFF